jgi:hypothetical protein
MTEPILVRVYDIVGGPLGVSTEDGQRLHDKIAPLLKAGTPVVLSFERIETMISAFLNAAVGQLYGELSEDSVDHLLSVSDMALDDSHVYQHVVTNAKAYFKDPGKFERAWREELGSEMDDEE